MTGTLKEGPGKATLLGSIRPLLGVLGLAVVGLLIYAIGFSGGSSYTLNIQFRDASQLIPGDLVEVGGLTVGSISQLILTNDSLADAVVTISSGEFDPLHQGTTAVIGTVGLSGIANRFIDVHPGPSSAAAIRSGGTIPVTGTTGVVDLDELLDTLTPPVRADLQAVIRDGPSLFAGAVTQTHELAYYAPPALDQASNLLDQVTYDKAAFSSLLRAGSSVAHTLAGHSSALSDSINGLAGTFLALASQRRSISDILARAPDVLPQADSTFAALRSALSVLNPALAAARPVAAPLAAALRAFVPAARLATPVAVHLRHSLPALEGALTPLPMLARIAVPTLADTTNVLTNALPLFTQLRPYVPDLLSGLMRGLGGAASSTYDANGHMARIAVELGAGLAGSLLGINLPSTGGLGYRTGLTKACPGGAARQAADHSNPYIPASGLCDPADDQN
jgi:phospholipid/cholesterol/gamma-HCH transport system substrate-binding protein